MIRNDEYLISAAKTEYREAHNAGDVERLLAVFAPEFTDWSEGEPSFYGTEARQALRLRAEEFFRAFNVEMKVIMVNISVNGSTAIDRGWHKVRLTNRATGEAHDLMHRYFESWIKTNAGWKISFIITNQEHAPRMLPEASNEPFGNTARVE